MTREDILRMAREAGIDVWWDSGNEHRERLQEHLERFAALVAAHTLSNIDPSKFMSYQEAYEAGQFAEREACAKLCDDWTKANYVYVNGAVQCAAAIRARGQA